MSTNTLFLSHGIRFNWSRVTALSGTFSFHVFVIVLMLMPLAPSELSPLPKTEDPSIIVVFPTEPPKATVVPPVPDPPPRTKTHPKSTPKTAAALAPVVPDVSPMPSVLDTPEQPSIDPSPEVTDLPTPTVGKETAPTVLSYAHTTKLPYPIESRRKREQGTVILRVLVSAIGIPEKVEVEKSSGYPKLDRAALEAVKQWRFNPGSRDGVTHSAWGLVPVAFRLDEV